MRCPLIGSVKSCKFYRPKAFGSGGLNQEFHHFVADWRAKANQYGNDLRSAFDRFFTLWVVYNRLYGEVAFTLSRGHQISLDPNKPFPDGRAAKHLVRQYIGGGRLMTALENDPISANEIQAVIRLLEGPIDGRQFAIKLNML